MFRAFGSRSARSRRAGTFYASVALRHSFRRPARTSDYALPVLQCVTLGTGYARVGTGTFGAAVAAGGTAFPVVIISALADADGIAVGIVWVVTDFV